MPDKRDWREDFKDLSFGDKRLDKRFFKIDKRFFKIMDDFADSPEESV